MTDLGHHDGGDAAARGADRPRSWPRYVYAGNLPGRVGDLEHTRCSLRGAADRAVRLSDSALPLTPDGAARLRAPVPGSLGPAHSTASARRCRSCPTRPQAPLSDLSPGREV